MLWRPTSPSNGNQLETGFPVLFHGVEFFRQKIRSEPLGNTVAGEMLKPLRPLVGAKHQPVAFLADIAVNLFISEDRQFGQALLVAFADLPAPFQ